ncbi:MAG: hypothetical protein J7K65_08600 [Planctomycetes bacterium]|nr:hypothetical protein [Planctomycetota bacterium]
MNFVKTHFHQQFTVVLLFIVIFSLTCQASSTDIASLDFQKVDPNKMSDELNILSSAVKANFDKIKTWQGRISFEKLIIYRGTDTVGLLEKFADVKSVKNPNELGQLAVGTTQFKIDLEKNVLFRHRNRPGPLEYIDFDKSLSYPSSAKQFERTIINTPEYEIKCHPYTRKKDGTVTSRFARKYRGKNFQWFYSEEDPRIFFYVGGPPWIQFPALSENLRLYREGAIDSSMALGVILEYAQTPEGIVYRVRITSLGSDQTGATFILDSTKGFNVTYVQEKNNGLTRAEVTRDFVKIDDIFLPSKQNSLYYDNNGHLQRDEKLILSEMQINMEIPKSTFSLTNLGLQEGDDYVDEIENKHYKCNVDGELVERTK